MEDQDTLVTQFCSIADTTPERARFYLESANWELPLALSSFYDSSNTGGVVDTGGAGGMDVDLHPELSESNPSAPSEPLQNQGSRAASAKSKETKKSSRFASFRDLEKEEDNSSEEEGQRYYAGGSEHSGELIVGPPRKKKSNEEIAKNLFKQAKQHGAQPLDASAKDADKSGDSKPKYFGGGGYKLGESNETSEFVPGEEETRESGPMSVVLRLWSNGFTVDDEPLRDFTDPENEEFLNSVKQGEIPRELLRKAHGGEVHVDMEDHRQEEYKAPKKKIKPFSGQGHMLGSPAPDFHSNTSKPGANSSSVDPPVVLDSSKPTTTLQIRLASGKRLKQEFNQNHRTSNRALRIRVYQMHYLLSSGTSSGIEVLQCSNKGLAANTAEW